jgi:hypothetical protein
MDYADCDRRDWTSESSFADLSHLNLESSICLMGLVSLHANDSIERITAIERFITKQAEYSLVSQMELADGMYLQNPRVNRINAVI